MMGLPRSGKSTIARKLSELVNAPIVQRDAIRLAVHGQRYEPAAEPLIKTLDIYFIRSLFLAGHEYVIADETNYSEEARKHLEGNWTIEWYPVLTKAEICKARALGTNQSDLLPVIDEMERRYVPLPQGSRLYTNWHKGQGGEVGHSFDYRLNPISEVM